MQGVSDPHVCASRRGGGGWGVGGGVGAQTDIIFKARLTCFNVFIPRCAVNDVTSTCIAAGWNKVW